MLKLLNRLRSCTIMVRGMIENSNRIFSYYL